jgi:predicted dithiol-disulfide oxidoreductase (DUF899 family)
MQAHNTVSREQWIAARKELLAHEKELTRARDRLSAERRALPWVRIDKAYTFDAVGGRETLGDLFGGRSQLIVQHFMLGPDETEGCPGCSFCADHVDGAFRHLVHHDVSFVAVSRAPLETIEAYRKRMGWDFKWVSSNGSDFNYDFQVSFTKDDLAQGKIFYNYEMTESAMQDLPGHSVFYKDADGSIFHTYSSYGRGTEEVIGAYMYLDLTPIGRNETGPYHNLMDWVKRHDQYRDNASSHDCCGSTTEQAQPKTAASH